MTATHQPEIKAPSRRAVIVGALGGIGAWAAGAIGRASPVRADGTAMATGGEYTDALTPTGIVNQGNNNETVFYATHNFDGVGVRGSSNSNTGVYASSTSGFGVYATSASNVAVEAFSSSNIGVYGSSTSHMGVYGFSNAIDRPASLGLSAGDSSGVQGYSGTGSVPDAKANTGVYGYAAQDNTSNGVFGESPAGRAIAGYSSSGYAGYFSGRVFTSRWMEFAEVTTPASPSANRARLFVRDSGGKTQLAVKFPNGTVRVLATEA